MGSWPSTAGLPLGFLAAEDEPAAAPFFTGPRSSGPESESEVSAALLLGLGMMKGWQMQD